MNINFTPVASAAAAVGRVVGPVLKAGAAEFGRTAVQCAAVTTVTVCCWGGIYYVATNAQGWKDKRDAAKAERNAAKAAKEADLAARLREAMNKGFNPADNSQPLAA